MKAKINAQLEPLCVAIDSLREDRRNARRHTPIDLRRKKRSLRKFGQQRPIVTIPDGTVIAGNGIFRMARKLGWEKIARVEYPDRETARAYAIADNRASDGAKWDMAEVERVIEEQEEFDAEFDPADMGFEDDDVLDADAPESATPEEGLTYSVIVDFTTEKDQGKLLARLEKEGLSCRLLIS